jgi:ribokinase
MTRIAVTGYASLDHVAMLDGSPRAGRTTRIVERQESAWPRLGGSPAYVSAALVANGVPEAFPVSWIGDDEDGAAYREQLAARRVPADGLEIIAGARTPMAILAYEPEGGCICLYHPGMPQELTLSPRQSSLVRGCDWVCVTIGPAAVTEAVLATIRPDARLAWVVKHDPAAMSLQLAARLAARADLIFCSLAESDFVSEALAATPAQREGQIVIETHGGAGAAFNRGGRSKFVPATPLAIADPTGAGDTFAGGALAALAAGESDPVAIVEAGHKAARALLETRSIKRMETA